jgi:hypothetical protein
MGKPGYKAAAVITRLLVLSAFALAGRRSQGELMKPHVEVFPSVRKRAGYLLCAALLLPLASAFAQAELPAKMQGMYKTQSGRTGGATLELIKQDSPDKARLRVNLTGTTNAHGFTCGFSAVEADAQKVDGAWKFAFPSRYCQSNWVMTIKPVEGKQRFEGVFTTDFPNDGTVYFGW